MFQDRVRQGKAQVHCRIPIASIGARGCSKFLDMCSFLMSKERWDLFVHWYVAQEDEENMFRSTLDDQTQEIQVMKSPVQETTRIRSIFLQAKCVMCMENDISFWRSGGMKHPISPRKSVFHRERKSVNEQGDLWSVGNFSRWWLAMHMCRWTRVATNEGSSYRWWFLIICSIQYMISHIIILTLVGNEGIRVQMLVNGCVLAHVGIMEKPLNQIERYS